MPNKKTLVIGASTNPAQYSHLAVRKLLSSGHDVEAIGREEFNIENIVIGTKMSPFVGIDTVTIYLNAERQKAYQEYILSLHPRRIIFNPGAENSAFFEEATNMGINALNACTLVMLSAGTF